MEPHRSEGTSVQYMEEGDEVRIHCIHGKVVLLVILNAHLWRLVYLMFAALRECIVQYSTYTYFVIFMLKKFQVDLCLVSLEKV